MFVALIFIAIAIALGLTLKALNDDPPYRLKNKRLQVSSATAHENRSDESRHFFLQVHGIYHRNGDGTDRQKVIRSCSPGELLQLIPEPDNPYDSNAIKVCKQTGEQLGYLDAGNAMRLTHDMAIGWTYQVTADEIFAANKPGRFGCRIRIAVLTMSARTEARKKNRAKKTGHE